MNGIEQTNALATAITNMLRDLYTRTDGRQICGQAVSYVKRTLNAEGWRRLGTLAEFEDEVERLGFKLVRARNSRGGWAKVVTVKEP